jgi:hypothetical protein
VTDTRLAPSILAHPVIDGLSDGAFRVYVLSLVYSVDKGLDGAVPARARRLLHPDGVGPDLVTELEAHGLWQRDADGHRIRNFDRYQSSAAEVERHRALARERKRREREKKLEKAEAALNPDPVTRDTTRDTTRDERATPPRTGTGAGQAQAALEDDPWKGVVVAIPGGRP